MAARYNSFDSCSSATSSLSSSAEFKPPSSKSKQSSFSRAIIKSRPADVSRTARDLKADNPGNLTTMMKKLMEIKRSNHPSSNNKRVPEFVIPSNAIAQDLKKTARGKGGNGFGALQRKLFGKAEKEKKEVKALTEVKGNTRTLAMVLRSERELLSMNKQQEMEIAHLNLQLEEKNIEVDKLKDLCLKQREEIKSLKSAILFPDAMNSQLQEHLEKQGSELKQAREIIPNLQRQVTSLTGQLQCLAEDLAEVKADNYKYSSSRASNYQRSSNSQERTSSYDRGESSVSHSLDFSSGDPVTAGSPDKLFLEDLNPCLTPCSKSKPKEFETWAYDSPEERFPDELSFNSNTKKLSRSSDCCRGSKASKPMARRSEESKNSHRKPMMTHKHL